MRLGNDLFFAEIERLLGEGSEVRFRIHGFSMRPLLRNGRDTVVVAPRGEEPLRVLDIVLFRYRGRHVLHRIVRIEGDRLTLAGDGNYRIREQCSAADVAGVVRRVVRPRAARSTARRGRGGACRAAGCCCRPSCGAASSACWPACDADGGGGESR